MTRCDYGVAGPASSAESRITRREWAMMKSMTIQRAIIVMLVAVAVLVLLGALFGIPVFESGGIEDSGVY